MKEIIVDTNYPNYEYMNYTLFIGFISNRNIEDCLIELIRAIDCTKRTKQGKRYMITDCYAYNNFIYWYIRCLLRITDYIKYNYYYNLLYTVHNFNLEFESLFVEKEEKKIKTPKVKKEKVKVENKFIKEVTHNLFTGEEIYIYFNPKTGEEIESDNPNLLDELNERLKRKSKVKSNNYIKPEHLHFNFNKHE